MHATNTNQYMVPTTLRAGTYYGVWTGYTLTFVAKPYETVEPLPAPIALHADMRVPMRVRVVVANGLATILREKA